MTTLEKLQRVNRLAYDAHTLGHLHKNELNTIGVWLVAWYAVNVSDRS